MQPTGESVVRQPPKAHLADRLTRVTNQPAVVVCVFRCTILSVHHRPIESSHAAAALWRMVMKITSRVGLLCSVELDEQESK